MIVCLCNAISERDIHQAASEGATTLQQLSERFNLGTCCGACKDCASDCLNRITGNHHADLSTQI